MVMALMAFQTVFADQLPQTGYSTPAQEFLKVRLSRGGPIYPEAGLPPRRNF